MAVTKVIYHGPNGDYVFGPENGVMRVTLSDIGLPPYEHVAEQYPFQQGSTLQGVNVGPRSVGLGLKLFGDLREDPWQGLEEARRRLLGAVAPSWGPDGQVRYGSLEFWLDDGTVRTLEQVVYSEGLEMETQDGGGAVLSAVARFVAYDPWFHTPQEQSVVGQASNQVGVVFPLRFPVTFAPEGVYIALSIDYEGTAPAWPTVTVTGPGNYLVVTNHTTGQSFRVEQYVDEGEQLVVRMAPGSRGVWRYHDGLEEGVIGKRTPDSRWIQLVPGVNNLEISLGWTGPTGNSQVEVTWRENYVTL